MYTVVKFSKKLNQSESFRDVVNYCTSNRCTQPVGGKVFLVRGVQIWRQYVDRSEIIKSWRDNKVAC